MSNIPTRTILITTACLLMIVAACVVVYMVNPSDAVWMPKCPFYALTGLRCPSCGSTRAMHQLLHGHIGQALSLNAYILVSWPLATAIIYRCALRRRLMSDSIGLGLIYAYIGTYVAWWIVRNIFAW